MSRSSRLGSVLIPVLIAFVILLAGEIALRYSSIPIPRLEKAVRGMRAEPWGYSFAPDALLLWRRGKHDTTIRTDGDGLVFRGEGRTGAPRVLFVGDSFTAGSEEGSYVRDFHAIARERGPGVEVINGGVIGYNGLEIVNWFDHYGKRYEPDIVIYAFYFNDVSGYRQSGTWRVSSTEPRLLISDPEVNDLRFRGGLLIPDPFELGRFARQNVRLIQLAERLVNPPSPYGLSSRDGWAREIVPSYSDDERANLADLLERLSVIVDYQRARGGEFAMILIPDGSEVVGPPVTGRYFPEIEAFCAERAILCVNSLPALREAQRAGTKTYWNAVDDGDAHATPAGYRIIAEQTFESMLATDWLAHVDAVAAVMEGGAGGAANEESAGAAGNATRVDWVASMTRYGVPRVAFREGVVDVEVEGAPAGIYFELPIAADESASLLLEVERRGPLTVRLRDGDALEYFSGGREQMEYVLTPRSGSPELLLYSDEDTSFTVRSMTITGHDGGRREVRRAVLPSS